jgi:hypothetical protein
MTLPTHDNLETGPGEAEATLRIIASLPAPKGLEDRVNAALKNGARTGKVLAWPTALGQRQGWMHSAVARGAAAAAIVFIVAGGGWSVYSRVQPAAQPKVIAMPRIAAPGGFSSAGTMRVPQTLNGPVLAHPAVSIASVKKAQSKKKAEPTAKEPGTAKSVQ